MLVTFSSPAYADITLFGDVAVHLIKLMGHSGTVPSALRAEQVRPALERLEAALKTHGSESTSASSEDEDDDEPVVTLSSRALPLIELLKAAAAADSHVMWDNNH